MGPLGFACSWESPRSRTWSGSALRFFQALSDQTSVIDVGLDPPVYLKRAAKLAFARRRNGKWITTWRWSRAWDHWAANSINRSARIHHCGAVLQVQDLANTDIPYYVWQDLNILGLLRVADAQGGLPGGFESTSIMQLSKRVARQRRVYASAQGLVPMSTWLARQLEDEGIPSERIHVIHPGSNIADAAAWPALGDTSSSIRAPQRLLFVGRDFYRKGGDATVAAFLILRQRRPDLQLTIIGPPKWPMPGFIPAGVQYLGPQSTAAVMEAMLTHDGFVMPSRFEAFGIAPAEALCCGLPPLVRNAFAMPEVVNKHNGVLVESLDVDEIVAGMELLLSEELRKRCKESANKARRYWSWSRAAGDFLKILRQDGLLPD
jgi:glycosyltransferase involved in cell wall biosynthesis